MNTTGILMKKIILDSFEVTSFNKKPWGFFIFPDGRLAGSDTHMDMLDICYDADLVTTEDYNYYGSDLICEETGAIRLAQSAELENYIELKKRILPTEAQYERLLEFLDQNGNLYPSIEVAAERQNIRPVKYAYEDYLPDTILKRIKRYFSSGHLYEELLDEAWRCRVEYKGFVIEKVSEYGWTGYFINDIKEYDKEFSSLAAAKKYIDTNQALLEDTRSMLIANSRNRGLYKDQSKGKNRFERKKHSKVANAVKQFNQIDMNKFFKEDTLEFRVPVIGETDSYEVTLKVSGVVSELARLIKANKNKFEFSTVLQAVTKAINTNDVFIHCTCPDHKFTYDYWNIVKGVSTLDSAQNPGPGKGIRNPKDEKGRGCKHALLVLANLSWLMKVAAVINNYIHYAEEKMPKPFANIIFPKLYSQTIEDALDNDLVDDEKFLDSSAGIIDAINDYGRNRGKYKPGSNKNPVTNTGGKSKANPTESTEGPDENQNQSK